MSPAERRKRKQAWNRAYRDGLKAEGLCLLCCKELATVGAYCSGCKRMVESWTASFRADESHCILCRRPRRQGAKHCEKHLAMARARSRRNRVAAKSAAYWGRHGRLLLSLLGGARRQVDLGPELRRSHRSVLRWLVVMQRDGLVDRWMSVGGKRGDVAWVRLTLAGRRAAMKLADAAAQRNTKIAARRRAA